MARLESRSRKGRALKPSKLTELVAEKVEKILKDHRIADRQWRRMGLSTIDKRYYGHPVQCSRYVPEGQVILIGRRGVIGRRGAVVGTLTYWSLNHNGRYPFETRYCRGVIEMERDRRRCGSRKAK